MQITWPLTATPPDEEHSGFSEVYGFPVFDADGLPVAAVDRLMENGAALAVLFAGACSMRNALVSAERSLDQLSRESGLDNHEFEALTLVRAALEATAPAAALCAGAV